MEYRNKKNGFFLILFLWMDAFKKSVDVYQLYMLATLKLVKY